MAPLTSLSLRLLTLSRTTLRTTPSTLPRLAYQPQTFQTQIRLATQDYGSGAGNPKGETPQQQGPNPSEQLEHPGPPPPDVGQKGDESPSPNEQGESQGGKSKSAKSGGKSATKKGKAASETESSDGSSNSKSKSKSNKGPSKMSGSPQKDSNDGSSSDLGHQHSDEPGAAKVKSGARPRFNTEAPKDVDKEDVERHNKEVEQRKAKAHEYGGEVGDEVGKGFWSGTGGADRSP